MRKKDDFYDDGRTVADMSCLEGQSVFSMRRSLKKGEKKQKKTNDDQQFDGDTRRIYLKAALISTFRRRIRSILLCVKVFFIGAVGSSSYSAR